MKRREPNTLALLLKKIADREKAFCSLTLVTWNKHWKN